MNPLPNFPLSITRTHPLLCDSREGGRGDEYMQPEKIVNRTTRLIHQFILFLLHPI
jgi:hypothetical protein